MSIRFYRTSGDLKVWPDDNVVMDLWFVSAASGLWYRNRKAAGSVAGIILNGVRFDVGWW